MSIRKRNIKEKKNKSFTLIELVIVVAILVGILAPQYTKYVEKSRKAADASNMDELVKAIEVYAIDGNQLIATEYELTIGRVVKLRQMEDHLLMLLIVHLTVA